VIKFDVPKRRPFWSRQCNPAGIELEVEADYSGVSADLGG